MMLNDVKIRREFASKLKDKNGKPLELSGYPNNKLIYRIWLMPLINQYFRTLQDTLFDGGR